MFILEQQVDALMRLCTATDERTRQEAREEIRFLLQHPKPGLAPDPETIICQLLLEMGAPDHLVGHPYTVRAIQLVHDDRMYIDNITFRLYPQIAAEFDTTAARVERAIRHLVEVTWCRGDWDTLSCYFGNTISPAKGKPTNGEFLARMANILTQRLQDAQR